MKKFLMKFSVYMLLLFSVLEFADIIMSKYLMSCDARLFKSWNEFYNKELNSDLVISGSSRAWIQYSPAILDSILNINAYNLGMDGSIINRQIIKYNTYCRLQKKKPKYLVQNIDLYTIGITRGYEREQFFPFLKYDKKLFDEIDKYEKFSTAEKYVPSFRYFCHDKVLKHYSRLLSDTDLSKGYYGIKKEWNGFEFRKRKEIFYAKDPEALKMFDDFISDVTMSGTKVIFVYAPVYIGATNKVVNLEGMYEMYDTIAKKYNVTILDYNFDPICYDTTCFYNAMHLNRKGSELFSVKLAHDIDSLGILK